ncbi:hypothetical protein PFISCL1PPCAC_26211, partial [Pristionchus fissidentatus]
SIPFFHQAFQGTVASSVRFLSFYRILSSSSDFTVRLGEIGTTQYDKDYRLIVRSTLFRPYFAQRLRDKQSQRSIDI